MKNPRILRPILLLPLTALLLLSCTPKTPEFLNIDFSEWELLNSAPITATIPGHGAGTRNIYINSIGADVTISVRDGRAYWNYPEGTIILKTARRPGSPEGDPAGTMLLGMIKATDHSHSQGGWLWVTRNPETGAETIFDHEYCVSCHADANEIRRAEDMVPVGVPNPDRDFRDFVFYPYFHPD